MSARRLLVTDHRTKVGQNGKNACEMVEIVQVKEVRFFKVFKFFLRIFCKKRILQNLSENIELKLLSRGISFFYQTMTEEK